MLCLQTSNFLSTLTCCIPDKTLGGCLSEPAEDGDAFCLLGDKTDLPNFEA